ncbi:hypothetical protein [Plantactinospora veratri]
MVTTASVPQSAEASPASAYPTQATDRRTPSTGSAGPSPPRPRVMVRLTAASAASASVQPAAPKPAS